MSEPVQPTGAISHGGSSPAAPPAAAPVVTPAPSTDPTPAAFRGPESLGGLLLILAGIAAAISLALDWLDAEDVSGLELLRQGFADLGDAGGNGLWQPLAILLGGAVLLVLGVVMWLPLRTHRVEGLVGLVVSLIALAAVLVPLVDAGWDLGFFGLGFWFGIAVVVLGLLGSLKAVLRPRS